MERSVYENMAANEGDHWWFRGRRAILRAQLRNLHLPQNASIVEVGCGTGGNLGLLSEFGQVIGVEPDELARGHAATSSGQTVLAGSLPDALPTFDRPADLIAALDVIEHLDDDLGALRALRVHLAPQGRLLTTVPAHPWLWSRHDVLHHHKRRYRKAEYAALLQHAGFHVEKISYFNAALFPAVALARLARISERAGVSDDALPPAFVNWGLERVFAAEALLLRRASLPFGVSLLAIARSA